MSLCVLGLLSIAGRERMQEDLSVICQVEVYLVGSRDSNR